MPSADSALPLSTLMARVNSHRHSLAALNKIGSEIGANAIKDVVCLGDAMIGIRHHQYVRVLTGGYECLQDFDHSPWMQIVIHLPSNK
jgi:hypothetical protein